MSRAYTGGQVVHGFVVDRVQQIPELRCVALVFNHAATGARLIHIVNEDPDKLFCCGFRTPVSNSTGVPHILEHSVLGGSRKFPFKDPFQQLLKSSLQTFLNALTYPDKTLYPVASQVERDFYNLVDVYCDAVFHPLLTEHTFCQEGWHFDVDDPAKPVSIKGIVYNEMKGVFSDFASHVGRRTVSALFPDTTYFFESGGEPEHIPELTYEEFRRFHATYYHPSNAFIFLYGNQSTETTLAFLDRNYLGSYSRIAIDSEVRRQPHWSSPRSFELSAPAPPEEAGTASVNVCWLFGESTDPVLSLSGSVLARYLIGAESSPLRRALIDSGLGEDLDVLCGFDNEMAHGLFGAGLRKAKPEHAGAIRDLIFDTLRRQAGGGIDEELLEGSLRQAEFGLREISGGGRWPYSLKLADRCYRSWIYGGDPLCHLAYQATLDTIRGGGSVAPFFARLIREALLDNPHYLLSVVKASPEMGKQLEHQTEAQALKLSAAFTPVDIERYRRLTEELVEDQKRQPTPEELAVLPKLAKEDLPPRGIDAPVETATVAGAPAYLHPVFCAGIAYLDLGFDCTAVEAELLPYLPLYTELATRCGAAGHTYEEMATRMALATGGISASLLIDIAADNATPVFKLFYHGKCLQARFDDMRGLMSELLTAPVLDDPKLIRDVLLELRNDMNSSVVGSGNSYASMHAASKLNSVRILNEILGGIRQLRFLEKLVKEDAPERIVERMRDLHAQIVTARGAMLSLTTDQPTAFVGACDRLIAGLPSGTPARTSALPSPDSERSLTGIEISASVNFVAKAWSLGLQSPGDIGTLSLLGANLSRGFLWDKVRVEGGAYGAFASSAATYPVFTCSSYRDPNLKRTLRMFEDALAYGANEIDQESVDQSVIATIGQIDKPKSPHGIGFSETCALLAGRSKAYRQQIREGVLRATPDAVHRKAAEILDSRETAITVLGSAAAIEAASGEGVMLECESLLGGDA